MKKIIALACLIAGCEAREENLGFLTVGTPRWAVTFGGPNNDEGKAAAVDSNGDVVVGGTLDSMSAPFAPQPSWIPRGFVTKRVASDGAERWTRTFTNMGERSSSLIADVAIGAQDTVIAVGTYTGTVDFGGETLTVPADRAGTFIAAFSPTGQLLWLRELGDNAGPTAVTTDHAGRIYVAGVFGSGSIDIGGTIYTENDGDQDSFLVAYDPQGTLAWGTAFQALGAGPAATGLAIAGNGDVLITGTLVAPASLGGAVVDPQADSAVFLTRFRNDGLYLASQRYGHQGAYGTWNSGIAVDAAGHIALQSIEENHANLTVRPNILHVLADDGDELWNASIDNRGSGTPQFRTLTTTPDGLIVTSAWTDNPVAPDEGSMEVVAYDATGQAGMDAFGARMVRAPLETYSTDTAVDATGGLAYTGAFAGTLDFGTGSQPAVTSGQDDSDVFIVAVDRPTLVGQP